MRIGFAISKSGPYAAGAGITIYPNYILWTKDVNEAGGIKLSDGTYTIELVEYDDQSSPEEAIKAIQRLVNQDKVDLLLPPWGTAMNLAVAPVFHQLGYPQLGVANLSDKSPDLAKQWPGYFSFLGTSSQYSEAIADLLGDLAAQGKIGKRVALPYVDAEFALDFVKPLRPALQAAGFEIVYDQGYPMEVSDMQSIVTEIMRLNPDAVIGITYPNDTMLYVPPMKVLGFDPPLFFLANGPNYYFYGTYADDTEGVMGLGDIDVRNQQLVDFYKRFAAFNGTEADRWGGHVYYVVGQVIQQAFERVGKIDRKAIGDEILKGTFDTIMGQVKLTGNAFLGNWLIGQWQRQSDGKLEYVAIMPRDRASAEPLVPKPTWKS